MSSRAHIAPLIYACATLYSIELAGNLKEIHGIDISSKMIETAKELNWENEEKKLIEAYDRIQEH